MDVKCMGPRREVGDVEINPHTVRSFREWLSQVYRFGC
jgi:hypothetical protein